MIFPRFLKLSAIINMELSMDLFFFFKLSMSTFMSPFIFTIRLLKPSNLSSKPLPNSVIWSHRSNISTFVASSMGRNYFILLKKSFYSWGIKPTTI